MSRTNLFIALNLVLALAAVGALAGDKPGQKPGSAQTITLDEFKARCANPMQFQTQLPPQNIMISCTEARTSWVISDPGTVDNQSTRHIQAALFSSKFAVVGAEAQLPVANKPLSCFRYKEMSETMAVEQQLSCEQVMEPKFSLVEFCTNVVDSHKGGSAKLAEVKETGHVIDTCGNGKPASEGKTAPVVKE